MRTNIYIYFDGACEEAFHFYEKNLGAKPGAMLRYEGMPGGDGPPAPANWIMHGTIKIGDTEIFASDAPRGNYNKPQGFALSLNFNTENEAELAFKALSDTGTVRMPLTETFFAKRFGMATDRFGIPWMVLCQTPMAGELPKTRSIDLTRTYDAPRALVWKVWTDPRHVANWWGPHGFTNPVCEWDARKGGKILIEMKGMGMQHPMTGEFQEVSAPERLVFTAVARDGDNNPLLEAHTVVTFTEQGGKTIVNVKQTANAVAEIAPQMLAGMEMGWSQSLERLGAEIGAAS